MILTQLVARWFVTDRLSEMAQRVAGRSRLAAWQRVHQELGRLSQDELRGFIRARTACVIHEETERLIEQEGPKVGKLRERIIRQATDSLIETILAQVQQQRAAQTQTSLPRRMAA